MFEGETDKLPLLTVKNKWSMSGPKMVANFINFDENPVELQIRGKFLNSRGKITVDDEPVAKFEGSTPAPMADKPNKLEVVSKMTIAPLGTSLLSVWSATYVLSLPSGTTSRHRDGCNSPRVLARRF